MSDANDTSSLQELLATHRRTLAVLLRQLANLGADHAPPGVHNGIFESRREIARLKAALRAADVAVEDRVGDVAAPDAVDGPAVPLGRRNRRTVAIVVVSALLLLSFTAFFGVRIIWDAPKTSDCSSLIGQQVHIPPGINAWSQHDVTVGGISRVFHQRTPVYVIGGKEWGIISYGTDLHGWWWEVSDTVNGESLGWVWVGQIEECR